MLLKNDRGADRRFEAVSFVSFDEFAKRSERASISFAVVRHRAEEALHLDRRVEPLHQFPLGCGEAVFVGFHCVSELLTLFAQKPKGAPALA